MRKNVFADREYRKFLILFIVAGGASSAGMPLVPLFLTRELDASLAEVGLLTVSGLLGVVAGPIVGKISDGAGSRSGIICLLAAWMGLGWAIMPVVGQFWVAIAVYVVMLAWIGPLNAQLFAGVSEAVDRRGDENPSTITATLRGGYSFGFMIGPVISTALVTPAGLRAAFGLAVGLYIVVGVLAWLTRVAPAQSQDASTTAPPPGPAMVPLLAFAVGVCLVIVGDMLRSVYLPIYVVDVLDSSETVFGALIAVAAGLEILVFPVVGRLADRFGLHPVMMAALVVGIIAYTVLATSTHVWQVWVFHVLQVVLFAATMGLGVTYAQRLAPGRSGLASSVFFSAQTGAKPVSGILAAGAAGSLGLPGIFWIPVGLCGLSLLGLVVASQVKRARPTEAAPSLRAR